MLLRQTAADWCQPHLCRNSVRSFRQTEKSSCRTKTERENLWIFVCKMTQRDTRQYDTVVGERQGQRWCFCTRTHSTLQCVVKMVIIFPFVNRPFYMWEADAEIENSEFHLIVHTTINDIPCRKHSPMWRWWVVMVVMGTRIHRDWASEQLSECSSQKQRGEVRCGIAQYANIIFAVKKINNKDLFVVFVFCFSFCSVSCLWTVCHHRVFIGMWRYAIRLSTDKVYTENGEKDVEKEEKKQ